MHYFVIVLVSPPGTPYILNSTGVLMRPYEERTPDLQYKNGLRFILEHGTMVKSTPQGIGAITSMEVPKFVYDMQNGFPVITERSLRSFWKAPINELFAFIRGVTTYSGLEEAGCHWWNQWKENGIRMGLPPDSLGEGSYGGAFARFPTPTGPFNQFEHVLDQMKRFPGLRTYFITSWVPFLIGRGEIGRAVVSPCHGVGIHFRVIENDLILHMMQRSADFPVGVPANIIQYAALLLATANYLGLRASKFVHSFSDAHIYEDQIDNVREIVNRETAPFPTVTLVKPVTDLFEVDGDFFEIDDYHPQPAMKIPVAT